MKAGAVVTAIAVAGCSTHYQPMPSSRISTVIQGGEPSYVHDGKQYPYGFFGGGLVDAVEGDPQATEAAETFHDRNVAGFVTTMVGAACFVGGAVTLASTAGRDGDHRTQDGIAVGALLCGLGGLIAGPIVIATGQPYQFDAVNIYNDHVERRQRVPAYYVPPPPPPPPR